MKVYVYDYSSFAGRWIYQGYQGAWEKMGYDVVKISAHEPISSTVTNLQEEYMIMLTDSGVTHDTLEVIEKSQKAFIYAQPNTFPHPWGTHPNFISATPEDVIKTLNQMDNVRLWTFGDDTTSYHNKWKTVDTVPLAYDSVGYEHVENEKYKKYDISFIGAWANNGFNEKRRIMIDIFSKFMKSGLNCGFFIEKNLTHEQESQLMSNSKMTLNIHDVYQRTLGCDTNERTFKSLGLNGCLVSDTVGQLNRIFPDLKTSIDTNGIVQIAKEYLALSDKELNELKEQNKQNILENHCYTNRVKSLLEL